MRHYEILLLINPDQSSQITSILDRYLAVIAKGGGKVHRQEDWGKQQLAYQIKKLNKAHYLLLNIECKKDTILELRNSFKFNDAIIRSLVTKCDAAIIEQSAFLKNYENEKNNFSNNVKDNNYPHVSNVLNNSNSKVNQRFNDNLLPNGSNASNENSKLFIDNNVISEGKLIDTNSL